LAGVAAPGRRAPRGLGADQSNTSTVVGGTHVLKVLRRPAPGPHPEVEVGRHLHEQADAGPPLPVAPLAGWYELVEPSGDRTTLGVVHRLVPGALDGWGLVLSALAADPGSVLGRLHRLGADLARLHGALARPGTTGGFGTVPVTATTLEALARATVGTLAGLEATVGHHLVTRVDQTLGRLVRDLGATPAGVAIRTHGDLHLGQTVIGPEGWVVLDFEGEPARPLAERRLHHPALRDVAGLLRSLSYAAETVRRAGADQLTEGWEPAARAALLDGYLAAVDPSLVPASAAATVALLALFEVEKAVYEIGYELAHRPDWVTLPVTGLARMLERVAGADEDRS
jgi:predicted trehalose synthase